MELLAGLLERAQKSGAVEWLTALACSMAAAIQGWDMRSTVAREDAAASVATVRRNELAHVKQVDADLQKRLRVSSGTRVVWLRTLTSPALVARIPTAC
jgi:hypothetical protein